MPTDRRTRGVDSARRALQILLEFTENRPSLTIDDIAEKYGISIPSVYRYLALLREMYLIEERSKGVFVLSPQILQLARAAERTLDYRLEAQPILNDLTADVGETSLYLRRINDAAVCLAIAEPDHAISISFEPGHVMALYAGAGAKVLLSGFTAGKRSRYLDRMRPDMPKEKRDDLEAELAAIRKSGFAESHGEVDSGVWACAAAVRHGGVLVGTISVVAPAYRTDDDKQATISHAVRDAATRMEHVLGQAR